MHQTSQTITYLPTYIGSSIIPFSILQHQGHSCVCIEQYHIISYIAQIMLRFYFIYYACTYLTIYLLFSIHIYTYLYIFSFICIHICLGFHPRGPCQSYTNIIKALPISISCLHLVFIFLSRTSDLTGHIGLYMYICMHDSYSYLSVYLSIYLSIHLPICLSIYLSIDQRKAPRFCSQPI